MVTLREDRCFGKDSVPRRPLLNDNSSVRLMARQLDRSLKNQEQADDGVASVKQQGAFGQPATGGAEGLQ